MDEGHSERRENSRRPQEKRTAGPLRQSWRQLLRFVVRLTVAVAVVYAVGGRGNSAVSILYGIGAYLIVVQGGRLVWRAVRRHFNAHRDEARAVTDAAIQWEIEKYREEQKNESPAPPAGQPSDDGNGGDSTHPPR